MSKLVNLIGRRFGRLLVVGHDDKRDTNNSRSYWVCECECGNTIVAHRNNLIYGRTKSCGCFQKEIAVINATKHSGCDTRLYRIWTNMLTRCRNGANPTYQKYGARGISVCDEWLAFKPFKEWAMSHGYEEHLTLDRIDNDGNYCPENCRWATPKEQANNTRKTIILEWNGERKPLREWSEITGIPVGALWKRIKLRNWDIEKALTTPLRDNGYFKNKEVI